MDYCCLGGAVVERWTRNRKIAVSTPGRGTINSTRSTQPSIPLGYVNRVQSLACMAEVKAGCVHLCGMQVTLCDPIWRVTLRSCEIGTLGLRLVFDIAH